MEDVGDKSIGAIVTLRSHFDIQTLSKCPHRTKPDAFFTVNTLDGIHRWSAKTILSQGIDGTNSERGAGMILRTTIKIH
jgi:hypothetical protein